LNFVSPYFVVSRYASRVKLFDDDPKPDEFEESADAVPLRLATSHFKQLYTAINKTWRSGDYWKASDIRP